MMIFAFSVIGLLVLLLIYFVLHAQNLQRELTLTRTSAKKSSSKATHAHKHLVLVTDALEKTYVSKIEGAFKSRLINQQQYSATLPLMANFSTIVMTCSEKGATLEEALKSTQVSLSDVQEVIKTLPSNIRMAWSKNSADGFIAACQLIIKLVSADAIKEQASSNA